MKASESTSKEFSPAKVNLPNFFSAAVRRLVERDVHCIEHGFLIDDATAKFVKENDVVISTQFVIYIALADSPSFIPYQLERLDVVLEWQENLIGLVKKYDITTGFATDLIGSMYTMLTREFAQRALCWTPAEVLAHATSESTKVISM